MGLSENAEKKVLNDVKLMLKGNIDLGIEIIHIQHETRIKMSYSSSLFGKFETRFCRTLTVFNKKYWHSKFPKVTRSNNE